jgi:hypothetical protein
MSGCAICIHDLHNESIEAYNASLDELRTQLTTLRIPEEEWPGSVREVQEVGGCAKTPKDLSLSAFEHMERVLRAKRAGGDADARVTQNDPS